jgi:hypothetical protein
MYMDTYSQDGVVFQEVCLATCKDAKEAQDEGHQGKNERHDRERPHVGNQSYE